MPLRTIEKRRWTMAGRIILLAGLLAAVGLILVQPNSRLGLWLSRASYDLSFALLGTRAEDLDQGPALIVYLDLDSYQHEKQNPAQPWDRTLHAKLVRRLTEAGARAIVFDIVFSDPASDPAADEALAAAIRDSGRVILAAEWNRSSRLTPAGEEVQTRTVSLPCERLRNVAAGFGFAVTQIDEDFIARRYFPGFADRDMPSLTQAVARFLHQPEEPLNATRWIRYYGKPYSIPHMSYSAALDEEQVRSDQFAGKVVFIGARPVIGGFDQRRDELRNPFSALVRGDLFMPGVEVHATQELNLLQHDWLRRLSGSSETTILLATSLFLGFAFSWARPLSAVGISLATECALLIGIAYLLNRGQIWFPWLIVATVQIPLGLVGSTAVQSIDWYRQRRLYLAQIRRQAMLIENAQDIVVVTALDGTVSYANPTAQKFFGPEIAPGRNAWALVQLDESTSTEFAEAKRSLMNTGKWSGELRWRRPAGAACLLAASWTLICDERRRPTSILSIASDVTERRHLEEQVAQAQRLETIGTLASGMTHDLNNSLAPVLMGLQTLHRRIEDPGLLSMVDTMESHARRGAEMVRQVLLFSRGQGDEQKPLELNNLVRELSALLRLTFPKGIEITELLADDLWPVQGNSTQLQQLLLNLSLNSRDAMTKGGTLTLATDNIQLGPSEASRIQGGRSGKFVALIVSDTGMGMPPEVCARMFEPFFTTKPAGKGTGLGLMSVQRIVQQHRGFVHVDSRSDEGTTFEVYLPALEEKSSGPAEAKLEAPRGQGELVLVIDDEQSVREFICTVLEDHGYSVVAGGGFLDSLALLHKNSEHVRLVVADWRVPGIESPGAASALRAAFPALPILVVSGNLPPTSPDGWPLPGPTTFLLKPFRLETLLYRIGEILQRETGKGSVPRAGLL